MTTIRDVAVHAGVSATTVSHVLNGTRRVDPGTVERVRGSVALLGYRPNAVARSMRHGQTYTIGIVIPDVANPFFADLARVLEDATFERGYSAIFCNSDGDDRKEDRYLDVLLSKKVDGIVLISAGRASDHLRGVIAEGPTMVIVDRELPDLGVSTVMVDNFRGGYLAGRYLAGLGHRSIGVVAGPDVLRPSARRLDGFRKALTDAGIALPSTAIARGDFRSAGGREAMDELLSRGHRLTAVFAENDMMAIGAMGAAHERGVRVPQDVSIMGFDDIRFGEEISPSLTTVAQPVALIATTAMQAIFEKLSNPGMAPTSTLLPVALVERESCSRVPAES